MITVGALLLFYIHMVCADNFTFSGCRKWKVSLLCEHSPQAASNPSQQTHSKSAFPWKNNVDAEDPIQDLKHLFKTYQEAIKKADHIIIGGAGQ